MADRTDARPQGEHRQLPSGKDLAYSGSGVFARSASNRGGVAEIMRPCAYCGNGGWVEDLCHY